MTLQEIQALIQDVPDFPKPGIVFKDITPLLAHPAAFKATVAHMADQLEGVALDGILGIESRGFIFGTALAQQLSLPLQLVRKRGKLPRAAVSVRYELEYGFDHLEMHADAIVPGGRYVIVDDLIATGGTAAATAKLVAQQQGTVVSCLFVIELGFLNGRKALEGFPVSSLLRY
jgi:adenine phosphoribosyltransferase